MDLNQLLYAHQLALMHIDALADGEDEQPCADKIALIAEQIRQLRNHDLVPPTTLPSDAGNRALINATYAGTPNVCPADDRVEIWESEGGSLPSSADALPSGITITWRPQYHVGPCTYSDLAAAKAEYARQSCL